ncbi:GNAT family N-acetyltransferase [Listeria goaensis]|uniref:GNAT family N-acetyltransferase n=1 Tax=Listeria goaensis TaxID=1649188 RepID=UPI001F0856E8|nr:GNAT family N-acetyltransferase [Listeria goaensis]
MYNEKMKGAVRMMHYQNLNGVSVETIYATFLDAFSDYALPMKPSLDAFQKMLVGKGFHADISVGAFCGTDLVGFILNAERENNFYNLGTGVKVAFRAQKIASKMLDASIRTLKERGAAAYVLEVLQENRKAFALYEQKGFQVARHFLCFRLDTPQVQPQLSTHVTTEAVDQVANFETTLEFPPSWQNNQHAILALRGDFQCFAYRKGEEVLGYAVINPTSQSLVQMGAQTKKAGAALLAHILALFAFETLSTINVDARNESLIQLLTEIGFVRTFEQYEMLFNP